MALLKIRSKDKPKEELKPMFKARADELGVSDEASLWIAKLMSESQKPFLRVSIRGGGCSGLTIHYELSDQRRIDDKVLQKGEAQVVIDTKSLSVIGGATLHCREYLGSKEFFLLDNPKEKQCSCGKSFSL